MQNEPAARNSPSSLSSARAKFDVFKLGSVLLMGIASGIPLALSAGTLQARLLEDRFPLSALGALAFIGLPYTLKFLWAPVFDLPGVRRSVSRRNLCSIFTFFVAASVFVVGSLDPTKSLSVLLAAVFVMVMLSASLDILIDGYRADLLRGPETGLGVSLGVLGYRLGMLCSGAGGLILSDYIGFENVYKLTAGLLLILSLAPLIIREADQDKDSVSSLSARETLPLIAPFTELWSRKGIFSLLVFIFLYKAGDAMAGGMTIPFLSALSVSNTEIGVALKTVGVIALILGSLTAGAALSRVSLRSALFVFGLAQLVSTAGYLILASTGDKSLLFFVVSIEYFCAGLGTSALLSLLVRLCTPGMSASQYALASALVAFGRITFEGVSGVLAERLGWNVLFSCSILMGIPALLILHWNYSTWWDFTLARSALRQEYKKAQDASTF